MTVVGTVREVWRFPLKSMAGERLQAIDVGPQGLVGDRGWAVRDEQAGEVRGAKKLPALLRCVARYVEEPAPDRIPAVEITLPDGSRCRSDAPEAATRLSALLGRAVTLWPRQPAAATEFYRRGAPDSPDFEAELRGVFGRLPDEPLPDLSVFSEELFLYTSPLGTYFDALPVHLLTTGWLAELARQNPTARFDVRRFRPNFVVEPAGDATRGVEADWCGRTVRVGEARLAVAMPCPRCVMTTLPQDDLPHDPSVLRTIVHSTAQHVGVYANVASGGRVAVGDPVVLED